MSSSSFAELEDSVSVSTPKCREELEEMKSSDGWGMYGCGSAKRMMDWTLLEMPMVTPMFMAPPSARLYPPRENRTTAAELFCILVSMHGRDLK